MKVCRPKVGQKKVPPQITSMHFVNLRYKARLSRRMKLGERALKLAEYGYVCTPVCYKGRVYTQRSSRSRIEIDFPTCLETTSPILHCDARHCRPDMYRSLIPKLITF
jgi:hypothetical protein